MSNSREDETQKITVPKFSSFKTSASLASAPAQDRHRKSRDSERDHRRRRHDYGKSREKEDLKRSDEGGSRQERESRRKRRSLSPRQHHHGQKRTRSREDEASQEPKKRHVDTSDNVYGVADLYVVDTKGDALLRKYGNNVHYHVSSSYRYPPGRVLGAEGRLFIHRDGPREQFSILQPGEKPEFIHQRPGLRSKWPRAHPSPVRLQPRKDAPDEIDEEMPFLKVGKQRKQNREHSDESEASGDDGGPSYRSIEGKMKVKPVSEDEESDSNSDEHPDIHQDNPLRWRSVQLNRQVKEHPEDIDTWLELVEHQDSLLKAGHDIDHTIHDNEAHSYAEIKLSLLESALSNTRNEDDRKRVLVLLMREGIKVWDRKAAAKRWADISDEERDSFELWKAFLDFRMSEVASFQYDEIKKILIARLRHLTAKEHISDPQPSFEEAIYVFLRLTRMVADAGYRELATSAWQALFELNLFRAAGSDGSVASMESFQEFWESEVPRFGEADAQGWRHFVDTDGAGEPLETQSTMSTKDDEPASKDPYKLWAALEGKQGKEARIPARTLDEGNDDDPFRVVIFSDIEDMIFVIPPELHEALTGQLVDAFLIFSGLPPTDSTSAWTELASKDPHVVTSTGESPEAPSEQPVPDVDETTRRPPQFAGRALQCTLTLDVLIPGQKWFHFLPASDNIASVPWVMVEQALKHVLRLGKFTSLGEYLLALANIRDPANTKKQAKALLKQFPTQTSLYAAYALAESSNGKHDVAEKTFASAAQIATGQDQVVVIRNWTWMVLEEQRRDVALRLLCSVADPELRKDVEQPIPASSTQVLKAAQMFESETHVSFYAGSTNAVALYGEFSLLLTYLTSIESKEPVSGAQGGISAAMDVVSRLSEEFRKRKLEHTDGHERLLQGAARILYWHVSNGPFRRSYMREQLTIFVEAFPRNTIFLSLLEWSDSGLRVIDETRQLLYEKSLTPSQDCISSRVFAIQHEMERGNVNSTRAAFDNAVSSDACRASVSIWVWYIQFSYSQKSLRSKAKDVFYRALRHCPWSKEVIMQAFTTLVRSMESDELRSVYNAMTSKGLRIHVELDDFLRKHEQKRASHQRAR